MSPFFPSAADTNAIVLLVFQHPIQLLQHHHKDVSQDDGTMFLGAVTATSNYYCPMSTVPPQDKESVLLHYLEEKHFGKSLTPQESTSFPFRQESSMLYSWQCPGFQHVSLRKLSFGEKLCVEQGTGHTPVLII